MVKVSDFVIGFVAELGIRHVFMVTGGGAMHLNDSVRRCSQIEYVCNLHEQASAMAAETYAKMTGDLGVCLVTTGPGGTNAVTGVAGAWLDSTPCLFISGQVKRTDLKGESGVRQLGVQEVDIVAIVAPITKYAITVMDPLSIRFHLEKAVAVAKSGRPGPVWVDIPLDVQGAFVDPALLEEYADSQNQTAKTNGELPTLTTAALALLNQSERPVLLVGNGVRLAGAAARLCDLMDTLRIPVLSTWPAHDLVPDSHPLSIGRPGPVAPRGANFALQNADFVLSVGARLDLVITGYAPEKFARAAKKVMVDIDASEIKKLGHIIDLPICADAGEFIEAVLRQSGAIAPADRSEWVNRCKSWKQRYPVVLQEYRERTGQVSTYVLAEALSNALVADDVIVSGSSGAGIEIFLLTLKTKPGQRVLLTTALGAMGYGLPAAIGACLGSGRRRTVCVDGDGGLQLNIQELETVARLRLPLKLFVLNNDGYASIRTSQLRYFGHTVGADRASGLSLPSLDRVAAAYGIPATRIETQRDLHRQVVDVLEFDGPVLCEVMSPPDEPRAPSLASERRPDGSMVSKPLEDLWPFLDRAEFRSNMLIPLLSD